MEEKKIEIEIEIIAMNNRTIDNDDDNEEENKWNEFV